MSLAELKLISPISLDLEAATEEEAIRAAVGLLGEGGDVPDSGQFLAAVIDRQKINPPLLGKGIALPHARTASVRDIVFAMVRLRDAVAFGPAAIPVRLLFLFGIPPHRISEYLALTASLVKCLRGEEVVEGLLAASSPEEFLRLLA